MRTLWSERASEDVKQIYGYMIYRVDDEDIYMLRLWHAARDEPSRRDLQ